MTPSELKYHVEQADPDTIFFDRKTMKFFGDTMANYGVRADVVRVYDNHHAPLHGGGPDHTKHVPVWELYRKRAVKHGLASSHYFDQTTYQEVHEAK